MMIKTDSKINKENNNKTTKSYMENKEHAVLQRQENVFQE
jgi:hypothetical protein